MARALLAPFAAFVAASIALPLHSSGPFHLGGFISAGEALGLRLGRVKRPNGLYTESLNIDVARYNILPPSGIYDPRFRDWQLSLEAPISSQLSLKLEYHEIEGTGLLFNQFGQNPDLSERVWQLWALKTSLSF